jgi:tubulin-specific chaperone A
VFGPLRKRIADAVEKLEEQIAISESDGTGSEEELKKAKEALASGQKLAAEEQEEI